MKIYENLKTIRDGEQENENLFHSGFESRCVFLQAENLLKAADNPFGGKECLAASLKEQSLKP